MKKLAILAAMVMVLGAPFAWAGSDSGCGLGQMVFEGQSGLAPNVIAVTLNATGSATFAVTTGTSGCDASKTVYNEMLQEHFVATNFEALSTEMARGEGQYLAALGELMGCEAAVQPELARLGQSQYENLFTAGEMDAKIWLGGLKQEMAKQPALAGGCRIS